MNWTWSWCVFCFSLGVQVVQTHWPSKDEQRDICALTGWLEPLAEEDTKIWYQIQKS